MQDEVQEAPTSREVTISGHKFNVSLPFLTGHVCTEAEAKQLNQSYAEAIRNNMAKAVKAVTDEDDAITANDMKQLVKDVAEYDANYEFTIGNVGGGRAVLDPVEKEARKIARELIASALKENGRKISEVNKEKLAEAIAAKALQDSTMKLAKTRLAERAKNAENALDTLDI